ncbi:MAG: hypothetical protein Q9220_000881 [cf. Caloplaca sp. 1 TL-2023]
MLSKPFRSPLLKRPSTDRDGPPPFKKPKLEPTTSEKRLVFKAPGISAFPRKPLLEVVNTAAAADDLGTDGYYSVLWRKVTNKKHKTWEGDALLHINGAEGLAELCENGTGRSMGKTKCLGPLLPGSLLFISGKDVEVEGVLTKAHFFQHKSSKLKNTETVEISAKKQAISTEAIPSNVKQTGSPIVKPLPKHRSSHQNLSAVPVKHRITPSIPLPPSDQRLTHRDDASSTSTELRPPDALVMQRSSDAELDVVVDSLLSSRLREHQRDGVKFLYECVMGIRNFNGQGAILADEMGLGKTLQTITLLWTLLKQSPRGHSPVIKKALIVCPATLINNWKKEFRKWLGLDRIGVLVADAKSRIRDFTHGRSYSVMIVGYEKLRTIQLDLLKGQGVDLIIADEAHRLKTAKNKSGQAIRAFPTAMRIFLTGTPVQNDLSEFYSLVDTVNPGILGSLKSFTRDFEEVINLGRQPGASPDEIAQGQERSKELMTLTSPFILRRTAAVLAKYLPSKTEHVLFCQPTSPQAALYQHILATPTFRAAASGNTECSLQLITILRKVCNSPSLLKRNAEQTSVSESNPDKVDPLASIPPHLLRNNAGSTKLRTLDQLLHTIRTTTTEKIVLVSNYTSTLDLLGNLLTSVGYPFSRMDGSTPSSKRQDMIDDFNRSPVENCFAFLLSAKTGGVGINLVGASRLVLFDVDWNPATDLQAMARIHREGQKRDCFIYRFLMTGGIDEKIWQRQVVKLGLAGNIVDQREETNSFTREDLKDLFRLDESRSCQTHDLIGCRCSGRGRDSPEVDSGAEEETLPDIPSLLQTGDLDSPGRDATIKATSRMARESLMAYTHIDPSAFVNGTQGELEIPIKDEVLLETLRDEGNKISFVFSKTSA